MKPVVVIQFPGVNCEYETVRALNTAGMDAQVVRWNASLEEIRTAPAIILPGGFAYQDRIRAGVVAAKDRIVDEVAHAAARGVPVMGICNGAQVLVEAGIVPDFDEGTVSVALAPNKMPDRTGYYCAWVRLKTGEAQCLFTTFFDGWERDGGTIPVPIAHAEGRVVTALPDVAGRLEKGEHVALYYATAQGEKAVDFPDNPNGSVHAIAGLTNASGNVLALMPHPERASWLYQVPQEIGGYWEEKRLESAHASYDSGPGLGFFTSLKRALE